MNTNWKDVIRGLTTKKLGYSVGGNINLGYKTFRLWEEYGVTGDQVRQVVAVCVKENALKLIEGAGDVEDPNTVYELIDYDKMIELLS